MGLALARLEAWVGFVDDVNAALATDQLVVAVALHQALEGIANFHGYTYMGRRFPPRLNSALSLAVQQGPVNHTTANPGKMQNIIYSQSFIVTALVFVVSVGSGVGFALYDRRPRESLSPPLLPTIPLLLISGLIALLALVHLVNLFGVKTGS
jgi:amino acid transporter